VHVALIDQNKKFPVAGCQPLQFGEKSDDHLEARPAAQRNFDVSVVLNKFVRRRLKVALRH